MAFRYLKFYGNQYNLFESTIRLIMENNFIQMAALADHAVTYIIGPIFKQTYRLCSALFHQWPYEYCSLTRQL